MEPDSYSPPDFTYWPRRILKTILVIVIWASLFHLIAQAWPYEGLTKLDGDLLWQVILSACAALVLLTIITAILNERRRYVTAARYWRAKWEVDTRRENLLRPSEPNRDLELLHPVLSDVHGADELLRPGDSVVTE